MEVFGDSTEFGEGREDDVDLVKLRIRSDFKLYNSHLAEDTSVPSASLHPQVS